MQTHYFPLRLIGGYDQSPGAADDYLSADCCPIREQLCCEMRPNLCDRLEGEGGRASLIDAEWKCSSERADSQASRRSEDAVTSL